MMDKEWGTPETGSLAPPGLTPRSRTLDKGLLPGFLVPKSMAVDRHDSWKPRGWLTPTVWGTRMGLHE